MSRKRTVLFAGLLLASASLAHVLSHASEVPQSGSQYKTIQPLHLMATYNDSRTRKIGRDTAKAYLHSERYADRYFVAFQVEVPAGTVVTVVSPESKGLALSLSSKSILCGNWIRICRGDWTLN
jgi:hypothetical protein